MTIREHLARLYRVTFRPHLAAHLRKRQLQGWCVPSSSSSITIEDEITGQWVLRDRAQGSVARERATDYEIRRMVLCPDDQWRRRAIRAGHGLAYCLKPYPGAA